MIGRRILSLFSELRWGEYSLLALYISILSGVVIGLQYDPATPLYSISTIDMLVPFGAYFRSLHFYSSQLFFLFCICHLIGIFQQAQSYSTKQWIKLTASLPVALLILFTGYVLRGDSTGFSAGMIAEAILLDIPYIGSTINDLFFSISDNGMKRIYLNHIAGFWVFWGWLTWSHVKKYSVNFNRHILLSIAIFFFSIFIAAPFEPDQLGTIHINGPWFFLGLQELLRYFPPLLAGVFFPVTLLIAIALLHKKHRGFRTTLIFILAWLFIYAIASMIALNR
ncbi:cytochrome b N-terminal domain-containing protein [bacterium]|nr:cytochrome b N-terminal domain-containing protein [bacterium]